MSPGGVGFDISCGVRLLATPLDETQVRSRLAELMDELDDRIVRGTGQGGSWQLQDEAELDQVLTGGAVHAVDWATARHVTCTSGR